MPKSKALQPIHLEGFTLQRSMRSNSGFVGVTRVSAAKCASRPFRAQADKTFGHTYLGHYETAEAAALVVAKHAATGEMPERGPPRPTHKVVFEQPPADFVAEAEGFQLEFCPHSMSGYKGVCQRSSHDQFNHKRPWTATWITVGGPHTFIGNFATKVEAAVAVARYRATGEKPPALNDRWPLPPPPPSGFVTEAEGFTLLRSVGVCGYKGVTVCRTSKSNPFKAAGESVDEPGKLVHLGLYPTAVEAAVAVARHAATGEVRTKRKRAVGRTGRGKKQHARESSDSSAGDSGYSDDECSDNEGDGDENSGDDHETKSDGDDGGGDNDEDDGDEEQETAAVMG